MKYVQNPANLHMTLPANRRFLQVILDRASLTPSKLSESVLPTAGDTGKDQRVYYFNAKELIDNKFGIPNPIPFRVVDSKIGLDIDVSVRCSGVYSYKIANPILFYTNVCGNVEQEYTRDEIDSQLKTEFISALQPAFGRLSDLELRPNQIILILSENGW